MAKQKQGTPKAAAAAEAKQKGPGLFKVLRTKGRPVQTGVPAHTSPRTTIRATPEGESEFYVDRPTAQAMVATGNFEIAADSQAKLKG